MHAARAPIQGSGPMPLFVPARRHHFDWRRPRHPLCAHFGQQVQIQFQPRSRGRFRTIKTLTIRSARGYFDIRLKFSSSGSVRLAWAYPRGDSKLKPSPRGSSSAAYSRVVTVTAR